MQTMSMNIPQMHHHHHRVASPPTAPSTLANGAALKELTQKRRANHYHQPAAQYVVLNQNNTLLPSEKQRTLWALCEARRQALSHIDAVIERIQRKQTAECDFAATISNPTDHAAFKKYLMRRSDVDKVFTGLIRDTQHRYRLADFADDCSVPSPVETPTLLDIIDLRIWQNRCTSTFLHVREGDLLDALQNVTSPFPVDHVGVGVTQCCFPKDLLEGTTFINESKRTARRAHTTKMLQAANDNLQAWKAANPVAVAIPAVENTLTRVETRRSLAAVPTAPARPLTTRLRPTLMVATTAKDAHDGWEEFDIDDDEDDEEEEEVDVEVDGKMMLLITPTTPTAKKPPTSLHARSAGTDSPGLSLSPSTSEVPLQFPPSPGRGAVDGTTDITSLFPPAHAPHPPSPSSARVSSDAKACRFPPLHGQRHHSSSTPLLHPQPRGKAMTSSNQDVSNHEASLCKVDLSRSRRPSMISKQGQPTTTSLPKVANGSSTHGSHGQSSPSTVPGSLKLLQRKQQREKRKKSWSSSATTTLNKQTKEKNESPQQTTTSHQQ